MTELRIHGRGGQGTVMASEMLAAAMISEGQFASCFPFFGQERRGAPVQAYIRFGGEKTRIHNKIYTPNIVMVLDAMLVADTSCYKGLLPGGLVIANGQMNEVAALVPAEAETVAVVDGNRIALETMGRAITNTTMLGCFARVTGAVKLESLLKTLEDYFTGSALAGNCECIRRGYEEVETFAVQGSKAPCQS